MDNPFQRQDVPKPVKMVVAACLLLAIVNLSFSLFYLFSTPVLAALALVKGLLGIAAARGLLNLSAGWRIFMLVVTGLGILILPLYFLAMIFSSNFVLFVSEVSGIDSWVALALGIALGFALFLYIFVTLLRPDVKSAFESGRQENFGAGRG
jgi:hypothetical protein|tara:strand:+ start:1462 stop:1917 length:456 start_codon:yes stop_codon:yes gene_type:complete